MERENKLGVMDQYMKVFGSKIKDKVLVSAGTLMETFMKVSGTMIKQMAEVHIFMPLVTNISECGKMINKKVKVMKSGQTGHTMKVNILME